MIPNPATADSALKPEPSSIYTLPDESAEPFENGLAEPPEDTTV
jgi:hypothetical protein